MLRFRLVIPLLSALLVVMGLGACSGEDCPINNTVQGKMVFCDQYGEAVSFEGTLTVSAVRPQGDTVVLNMKSGVSEILFPLSYAHTTDTLILDYNEGMARDSIYVSHTNIPTLVSVDCGVAMFHTLTSVGGTHHVIDSLSLQSLEVNYDERENIQVYYPVAD